jgi:hypothetical protein
MAKYHVNKATGEAGACRATKGKCPFGGEAEHFTSREAARQAFESSMAEASAPQSKTKKTWSDWKTYPSGALVKGFGATRSFITQTPDKLYLAYPKGYDPTVAGPELYGTEEEAMDAVAESYGVKKPKVSVKPPTSSPLVPTSGFEAGPLARPDYSKLSPYLQGDRLVEVNEAFENFSVNGVPGDKFEEFHRLMEKAYANVNDGQLDSLDVARILPNEFKRIATTTGTVFVYDEDYDHDEALDNSAFAYVSPRIYKASKVFEGELNYHGWTTRNPTNDPYEFERIYARASKKAGADASHDKLARHVRDEFARDGVMMDDSEEMWDHLERAAGKAKHEIQKDQDFYARELDAIA